MAKLTSVALRVQTEKSSEKSESKIRFMYILVEYKMIVQIQVVAFFVEIIAKV